MAEVFVLFGAFVMFTGAYGFFILRDPFQRFHAAGKVSLFGLAILILGEAIALYQESGEWHLSSYIGIFLLLFVGPFASHILARALYRSQKRHSKL